MSGYFITIANFPDTEKHFKMRCISVAIVSLSLYGMDETLKYVDPFSLKNLETSLLKRSKSSWLLSIAYLSRRARRVCILSMISRDSGVSSTSWDSDILVVMRCLD